MKPFFQGRKINESYYKSQHTGSFGKRRKKRTRCADSYELRILTEFGIGTHADTNYAMRMDPHEYQLSHQLSF